MIKYKSSNNLIFTRSFPVGGPSIADTDSTIATRFRCVGEQLGNEIDYLVRHEWSKVSGGLGVLNTPFKALQQGDSNRQNGVTINVTPMGGTDGVLFGCFDLRELTEQELRRGLLIDLLGSVAYIGESGSGYVVLDRDSVGVAGFGIMSYSGGAVMFDETPNDEELNTLVKDWGKDTPVQLARPDKLIQPPLA